MASKLRQILVVDDDRSIHKVMEMILRDSFDLMFVEDAKKALDLIFFNGKTFDLILLDIVMPKMDGLELLRKIREINLWIPVMIITAYSSHDRAKEACNLNVAGYIEKPFDVKKFQEKVNDLIWNTEIKGTLPSMTLPNLSLNTNTQFFHPVTVRSLYEIHKRFHTDFSIDDVASACAISKHHLCKLFKKDSGMTIRDYTNKLRIQVAKKLLQNSAYTVSTIQESLGYKSRSYFFNIFKDMTGVSPLEFRKTSVGHKKGHTEITQ
jgi:YesN/AraC family two-component response regulator